MVASESIAGGVIGSTWPGQQGYAWRVGDPELPATWPNKASADAPHSSRFRFDWLMQRLCGPRPMHTLLVIVAAAESNAEGKWEI